MESPANHVDMTTNAHGESRACASYEVCPPKLGYAGEMVRGLGVSCLLALGSCNAIVGFGNFQRVASTDIDDASTGDDPPHGERTRRTDAAAPTPSTQTDAGFDATTSASAAFTDLFDRADSPTIGNGWTEKSDVFSISNGAVVQTGVGQHLNLIVWRADLLLDTQIAVDVTFGANPDSDPCLHLRMQPASDALDELVSYTFYAQRGTAGIDREDPGVQQTPLAIAGISPPLETGKSYHLIFRVVGTNPVKVEATVTRPDGSSAANLSADDASDQRIMTAGRLGFGSSAASDMRWDNFTRTDL